MTSANAIVELMKIPAEAHDLAWLKRALQAAVQLEFATIPPYLSAYWSIKDLDGDIASTILGIALDEMRHMGLVCNLLAGLGEQPKIAQPDVVPSYPGYLPGGVHPDLIVALRGLSRETASTFTSIELPKKPLAVVETFPTIGEFYDAILDAFNTLNPALSDASQVARLGFGLTKITTLDKAREAIELIKHQGEGSTDSPVGTDASTLAHYYLFKEIATGHRLVKDEATGEFSFTGADVPLPDCYPVAEVPKGGYVESDVTADVWQKIKAFDEAFSTMLKKLESTWSGTPSDLSTAISTMRALTDLATPLVQIPIPQGAGNYGPCFRLIPA